MKTVVEWLWNCTPTELALAGALVLAVLLGLKAIAWFMKQIKKLEKE